MPTPRHTAPERAVSTTRTACTGLRQKQLIHSSGMPHAARAARLVGLAAYVGSSKFLPVTAVAARHMGLWPLTPRPPPCRVDRRADPVCHAHPPLGCLLPRWLLRSPHSLRLCNRCYARCAAAGGSAKRCAVMAPLDVGSERPRTALQLPTTELDQRGPHDELSVLFLRPSYCTGERKQVQRCKSSSPQTRAATRYNAQLIYNNLYKYQFI